jgi:biopolymer transport protein ExbB
MRHYANSKFRLMLLTGMAVAVFIFARSGLAQSPTTAPAAPAAGGNIFSLVRDHIDFIFITIAGFSVWGVTLMIQGFLQNRRSVYLPPGTINTIREMIANRRYPELVAYVEKDESFVSQALYPALKRAPHFDAMREAMETAIGEQTAEQFRKIEYLNIIGNMGPLLGLLGTVWGMIQAFQAMNLKGGAAAPADLAGGIAMALTHTFLGLFLAVPCLATFGILRTMVDRLTTEAALEAEELLIMIKPQEARVPGHQPSPLPRPASLPTPSNA